MKKTLFKIAFSIVCIAFIIRHLPLEKVGRILGAIDPTAVGWAVAASLAAVGVYIAGLRLSMRTAGGARLSYLRTFSYYFYAIFFSFWLPSSFGRDAAMIFFSKEKAGLKGAFSGVLFNRFFGMLSRFVLVMTVSLFVLKDFIREFFLFLAFVLTGILALSLAVKHRGRFLPPGLRDKADRLVRILDEIGLAVRRRPGAAAMVFAAIMTFALFDVTVVYLLGRAVGADVPFYPYLALAPLVNLLTLLPVSFAGVGLQDISFIGIFSRYTTMTAAQALSISLLYHGIKLVHIFIGFVLYNSENVGRILWRGRRSE